jgi:hypothetical protein
MYMLRRTLLSLIALGGTGCASSSLALPRTAGEIASGYGYVPLDGLGVREIRSNDSSCDARPGGPAPVPAPLLSALPDLTVRFAVASVSASGGLEFGPAKFTAKGETYRAVLDYVNVDVIPVEFLLRRVSRTGTSTGTVTLLTPLSAVVGAADTLVGFEALRNHRDRFPVDSEFIKAQREGTYTSVTIPVYVGVGMRLQADIRARQANIALTSLGAIAAEAQTNALAGTLTVQTLGITGRAIATVLPLPSKLDQTTVENAILALGSSRAALYASGAADGSVLTAPRVVGLYSSVGSDPRLISVLYSELSREPPVWPRRCIPVQ